MGPRAAQVEVQSIPILLSWELGAGVFGDEVPETTVLSTELPIGIGMLVYIDLRSASQRCRSVRCGLLDRLSQTSCFFCDD